MGNFMDQIGLSIPDPMNGHLHSVFTPPEEDQSAGDSELRPDEHVDALHLEKFVFLRRPQEFHDSLVGLIGRLAEGQGFRF